MRALQPDGRAVRCAPAARVGPRIQAPKKPLELAIEPFGSAWTTAEPAAAVGRPHAEPARRSRLSELPKVFRGRAQTRAKVREAAATGVVWAGLGGVLVLLLVAAVVLRQDIAQIWPRTAGVYAMAGLPVNLVGLTIEDQHAQPALKDGRAVLVVSGALRNIRDQAVAPPPLRVSLLNPAGRPVAVEIAVDPGGARIPPGEARRFVVNVLDPPVSASDVQIDFVMNGPRRKPVAQAATPAAATATAPAPALAGRGRALIPSPRPKPAQSQARNAPLPQTSPYALQPAAAGPTDAAAPPHG